MRRRIPRRAAVLLAALAGPATAQIVVHPADGAGAIQRAMAAAPTGATIRVAGGVWREPVLRIDRPLTLEGTGGAVLDGSGGHTILEVAADDVTVRGFVLRDTGPGQTDERAGIRVRPVRRCRVEDNRIERALFGVYLERTDGCVVRRNIITGTGDSQMLQGNGIHAWQSTNLTVSDNQVRAHRDGIFFEFVTGSTVTGNTTRQNLRYGLHFMFSDDCRYEGNTFASNGAGVAVMYSHRVTVRANTFTLNRGGAAYGLLLKDISDSEILGNAFTENSTGLYLEDSNRNRIEGNTFAGNGWALRLLANATDNVVSNNSFEGNSFDVATNSRSSNSTFRGNWWDRYRGYDLDHDGIGDVPHAPVRLFALIVAQTPATIVLLRSLLSDALDVAERVLPMLTPETLVDAEPLMRRPVPGSRFPAPGSR